MAEDFNSRVIREFRENDGRVGEPFTGLPMVLVHHVGAKSGTERVAPLRWFADGDSYVVVASAAGAPKHPAWFHNLMANPDVVAEIADGAGTVETVRVHASELGTADRDRVWTWIKDNNGGFADYERKTDRTIPLVALTPQ
ncbi:AclJ [Pseudonocardia sp. Ae168_Ps1]|jgi:deazaflavin-dependent oxidoreductase (nitroreductase family)|uniref:nitroreductase/quinone reductase family protein n=1 Tax=unclassified Pseudonocardia TaxID=2619320 RepID=UPI0001FFE683|nr:MULTISPECIES: nitroreductase/quinone reductase family protein [unclassified Pseudonocardia]ALE74112.1 cell entry protein [Pseudonocardia sp. EC080625-04]ALL77524.1 cell entry protein [Pseudonocardia sp. EC080610-09]ALL80440.1 cell entry protein [Pseudonocardia sp. EC080619-01]OLL71273.1 AclJ [Pseudonocardia sp. Ae168_Ps1]OLL77175.1 AclJ [Pseudonocardia sp. Ae150A_Ps1]